MKKIIAFAGSNSKNSINKQLATYTANQVQDVQVQVLDLNDFSLPIYSIDIENESGIPDNAQIFLEHLNSADGIVLSLAEHNGAYSAVFKNIYDWMSRIQQKVWNNTPMFLMATSPGARGGQTVLNTALGAFPYLGGNIVAQFSLPSFNDNFSDSSITNDELSKAHAVQIEAFETALKG